MFRKASLSGNGKEPGILWEVKGWRLRVRKEARVVEKGDG